MVGLKIYMVFEHKKSTPLRTDFKKIGVTRLELATSWSLTRRANQTTLHPDNKPMQLRGLEPLPSLPGLDP